MLSWAEEKIEERKRKLTRLILKLSWMDWPVVQSGEPVYDQDAELESGC
jgi:hypothetical protein